MNVKTSPNKKRKTRQYAVSQHHAADCEIVAAARRKAEGCECRWTTIVNEALTIGLGILKKKG